jgi:hypothetical protein
VDQPETQPVRQRQIFCAIDEVLDRSLGPKSWTDLTSTYWSVLPKDWIRQGLEVNLKVDTGRSLKESNEANNAQVLKPSIGTGNRLYLMMVPIIQGGKSAVVLSAADLAELKSALMRYWPLADVDIQVREPYTIKTNDGFGELVKL